MPLKPYNIKYFKSQAELRKWFMKNHSKLTEQWVGIYKKGSGKPTVTYSEAVDEALCFGWIDGIAKGLDDKKYCQRFTPRKPKSIWSAINIKKIGELIKRGRMTPAGLKKFNERDKSLPSQYSFEQEKVKLPAELEKKFKTNKKAWKNFNAMPPGYRRTATWYVISPKQEATRLRRLEALIADSEAGRKIKQLRRARE